MINKLDTFRINLIKDDHMSIKDGMWDMICGFNKMSSIEEFRSEIYFPSNLMEGIYINDKRIFQSCAYLTLHNLSYIFSGFLYKKFKERFMYRNIDLSIIRDCGGFSIENSVLLFKLVDENVVTITGVNYKHSNNDSGLDSNNVIHIGILHLFQIIRETLREYDKFMLNFTELFVKLTENNKNVLNKEFLQIREMSNNGELMTMYAFVNIKKEWEKYKKDNNLTEEDIDRIIKEDVDAYYKKHPEILKEQEEEIRKNFETTTGFDTSKIISKLKFWKK